MTDAKAPSSRIRFRLKTQLFPSVFQKNSRPHVAFSDRFRPSTLKRFENGDNADGACAFTSKMSHKSQERHGAIIYLHALFEQFEYVKVKK